MRTVEHEFIPYGPSHLTIIGILVAVSMLLVWLGRTRPADTAEWHSKWFALAILAFTIPLQLTVLITTNFNPQRELPVQLCDIAAFVAPYALWTKRPWATAATYFWALTLVPQAVITPDLRSDFPSPIFVLFWGMHLLVVWAAVYLTWGLRITPTWRSFRFVAALTAGWLVSVFALNQLLGTNYGYVNAKPRAATILDYLGPWPYYVFAEVVIVAVVWALMTWPWVRRNSQGVRVTRADGNLQRP
jgi:hypothetical integral membrane protein (TIGR02206 family)